MFVANFFCRKSMCYNKLHPVICTNIGLYNWTRKRSGVENVSVYFSYELNFMPIYFLKRTVLLNIYISKTKLKSSDAYSAGK